MTPASLKGIARNLSYHKLCQKFLSIVDRQVYRNLKLVNNYPQYRSLFIMPPKRKRDAAIKNADDEQAKPSVTKKPRGKGRAQKEIKEDSEPVVSEPKPKRKRANYKEESSNSDSEVEQPTKVSRRNQKEDSDSDLEIVEKVKKTAKQDTSDSDEEMPAKSTKKLKKADSDEDDEEVVIEKPKKGRKRAPATRAAPAKNKTSTTYGDIDLSCTKKSASGKDWNFKISNWNVDGIRAWLKKGGLDFIHNEKPDILCLQETKCGMEKLPAEVQEIDGYNVYWHCSNKDGYAGVGLFSKVEPVSVKYGLGHKEHDDEGRMITAEFEQFYVISVYVPNAGRGLVTLPKRLKWNEVFRDFVNELDKKKPVIVCGDMNVAHTEIDLANPKTNTKNAGFTKEEREGMTEFLGDGFVDTFRHFYPDQLKAYTFWTYMANCRAKNVGWRLDYFIVSERYVDSVCDTVIRNEVFGSDHCPITLFLNVN